MQKSYVLFDDTWRKNLAFGLTHDRFIYLGADHFGGCDTSLSGFRLKSYGSNSGFNVLYDLDLWPMLYWLAHKVGMN